MLSAEQARKDLESNKAADDEKARAEEMKRKESQRKEMARALKEDVPKLVAELEKKIYHAVANRENKIQYEDNATLVSSAVFDAVKKELESHGYKVKKEYESGTTDYSDEVRNIPYENYILYITW